MRKILNVLEKRTTEILILTTIILFAGVGVHASGVLDSGSSGELVAEYRFDTGAGDTAYDTAGNNDGSLTNFDFNSDSGWTDGKKGKALEFDGKTGSSGDYIATTNELAIPNQYTLSTWVKGKLNEQSNENIYVFGWNSKSGLALSSGSGSPRGGMLIRNSADNGFHSVWSGTDVLNGKWNHIAATVNRDNGEVDIYINGNLDTSDTIPDHFDGNRKMIIGAWSTNYGNLDGKMDEARYYSKALNHSQIKSLYNQGSFRKGKQKSDDPNLIQDISFQSDNSTDVFDTSGYQNHGQPQNGYSQETAGGCKVGRCYEFDGSSNTGVDLNDIWSDHTESRTIMFWFKEAESGASQWDRIISQDCSEWFCLADYGTDTIRLCYDGCSSVDITVDESKWHHSAMVFDESVSRLKLYIDGKLKKNISYSSSWSHLSRPIVLGGNTEGTDDISGEEWEGRIDQLKIFNRSLSQSEIVEKTERLESNGAVLDMRFKSGGGDHVGDHSIQENHGVLKPNETAGPSLTKGVRGSAYDFDGDDDLIDINDFSYGETVNEISFSFWMRSDGRFGEYRRPINNADNIFGGGADDTGFDVMVGLDDKLQVGINGVNSDNGVKARDIFELEKGEFYHVVGTWNGSELEVYVDGALNKTVSGSTDGDLNRGTLTIGARNTGGQKWNGLVDEVKIYPFSVSEQKVEKLYQQGVGFTESPGNSVNLQDGLVLDQTFNRIETCGQSDTLSCPDGMSGEVAVDESGESIHGELFNDVAISDAASCKVGECLELDGDDDYIDADDNLDFNNGKNFSVSTWVRADSFNKDSVIWKMSSYTSDGWGIRATDFGGDNHFTFIAANDTNRNKVSTGNLETDKWYHLVGSYQTSEMKVFIDGKRVNQGSSIAIPDTGASLRLGQKPGVDYSTFDGEIDQTRVYNRSLSKQEVWKLYTQGRDREQGMAGPVARYRFDAGPRVCILNQGGLSDGGRGGPSDSELKNALEGDGWNTRYVQVGDITQDGWKSCEVIVFPNNERYPAFDKSANFCSNVNGEGTEHDVFLEMKEFMNNGGMWVGTWGAGLWYGQAWDGNSWTGYTSCSQYSGDNLYKDGGGARCSNIGYSCYSPGTYDYSNINQSVAPALSETITGSTESGRWASNLDVNLLQAYDGSTALSGKYAGLENVGRGWYFHPGGNHLFNPGDHSNAGEAWNNLLTWYAGDGGQNFWDSADSNTGSISGDGNAPAYTSGKRGKALEFDGSNDYVDVSSSRWSDYFGDSAKKDTWTTTAWVKVDNLSKGYADSTAGAVVGQRYGTYTVPLGIREDGSLFVDLDDTRGSSPESTDTVSEGEWYHVAASYSWSDDLSSTPYGTAQFYINGEKAGTDTNNDDAGVSTSSELYIGRDARYDMHLEGKIDDVRIYPYALSQQQVKKVTNSGGVSVG